MLPEQLKDNINFVADMLSRHYTKVGLGERRELARALITIMREKATQELLLRDPVLGTMAAYGLVDDMLKALVKPERIKRPKVIRRQWRKT